MIFLQINIICLNPTLGLPVHVTHTKLDFDYIAGNCEFIVGESGYLKFSCLVAGTTLCFQETRYYSCLSTPPLCLLPFSIILSANAL